MVPMPNIPMVPIRVIADTAADACPTAAAGAARAASHQYAKPNSEVIAVVAITDALRQETTKVRATTISPGVTESELAGTITHEGAATAMRDFRRVAIPAGAVAEAIAWAIAQPDSVDVSEIIIRPTASPY